MKRNAQKGRVSILIVIIGILLINSAAFWLCIFSMLFETDIPISSAEFIKTLAILLLISLCCIIILAIISHYNDLPQSTFLKLNCLVFSAPVSFALFITCVVGGTFNLNSTIKLLVMSSVYVFPYCIFIISSLICIKKKKNAATGAASLR